MVYTNPIANVFLGLAVGLVVGFVFGYIIGNMKEDEGDKNSKSN